MEPGQPILQFLAGDWRTCVNKKLSEKDSEDRIWDEILSETGSAEDVSGETGSADKVSNKTGSVDEEEVRRIREQGVVLKKYQDGHSVI